MFKNESHTYPTISIITPSFNQGSFIEETILSVIGQEYPSIEYIIIDGGSTDNSVEIIKRYSGKICYWVSEPDNGQADAINKGMKKATGEIIAFINSDDFYEPGTFKFVAEQYNLGNRWIIGSVTNFRMETNENYIVEQKADTSLFNWLRRVNQNHQPGNFWSREILEKIGYMDVELQYSFDWDYWLKMIVAGFKPSVFNDRRVARFRLHNESKTVKFWSKFDNEYILLINKYKGLLSKNNISELDAEIKKLLLNEKVKFGRIESINGEYKNAFSYFMQALAIHPTMIIYPKFIFEFFKAMVYMPIRRGFTK